MFCVCSWCYSFSLSCVHVCVAVLWNERNCLQDALFFLRVSFLHLCFPSTSLCRSTLGYFPSVSVQNHTQCAWMWECVMQQLKCWALNAGWPIECPSRSRLMFSATPSFHTTDGSHCVWLQFYFLYCFFLFHHWRWTPKHESYYSYTHQTRCFIFSGLPGRCCCSCGSLMVRTVRRWTAEATEDLHAYRRWFHGVSTCPGYTDSVLLLLSVISLLIRLLHWAKDEVMEIKTSTGELSTTWRKELKWLRRRLLKDQPSAWKAPSPPLHGWRSDVSGSPPEKVWDQ